MAKDITGEIKRILEARKGKQNAISAGEISEILGLKQEDTHVEPRKWIKQTMFDLRIPIGSSSKGYYLISTEDELENYVDSLNHRRQEIKKRADAIQEIFSEYYG
jgi:hypothetical protein